MLAFFYLNFKIFFLFIIIILIFEIEYIEKKVKYKTKQKILKI